MRYIIDRRHILTDSNTVVKRRTPQSGDFNLKECIIDDLLVTIWNPNNFRPFMITLFNGHCSPLRKQWLFYDILTADSITGVFDNSLFSIHSSQPFQEDNSTIKTSIRSVSV
jgi:distribution and morphology protein 31